MNSLTYYHQQDLKPANFVFVKGCLKLIDFGIAKAILNENTSIYRDSQIGTLNYMVNNIMHISLILSLFYSCLKGT